MVSPYMGSSGLKLSSQVNLWPRSSEGPQYHVGPGCLFSMCRLSSAERPDVPSFRQLGQIHFTGFRSIKPKEFLSNVTTSC